MVPIATARKRIGGLCPEPWLISARQISRLESAVLGSQIGLAPIVHQSRNVEYISELTKREPLTCLTNFFTYVIGVVRQCYSAVYSFCKRVISVVFFEIQRFASGDEYDALASRISLYPEE